MSRLLAQPLLFYQDANGKPLPGALCYVYFSQTTNPAIVYQDGALTIPHANPIVALTDGYFPAIYGPPGVDLKLVLTDASGAKPKTIDPASLFVLTQGEVGEALYPTTDAEDANLVTPVSFAYPPGYVQRQGMTDNSSSDWTSAFQDVLNAAAGQVPVIVPRIQGGYYKLTGRVTAPAGTHIILQDGAELRWTATTANGSSFLGTIPRPGIEVMGDTFRLSGNGVLRGPANGTFLSNECAIYAKGTSTNARLSGFVIEGDIEITGWGAQGILAQFLDDIRIVGDGIYIHDVGYAGCEFLSCNHGRIKDVRVGSITPGTSGNAYGVTLSHDSTNYSSDPNAGTKAATNPFCWDWVVENNTVYDVPLWAGLDAHGGYELKFANNRIYNCRHPLSIASGSGDAANYAGDNNQIIGNYATDHKLNGSPTSIATPGYAIVVSGGSTTKHSGVIVADNILDGFGDTIGGFTGVSSIRAQQVRSLLIARNIFRNWLGTAIYTSSSDGIIEHNVFEGVNDATNSCCIFLDTTTGVWILSGNKHYPVTGTAAAQGVNINNTSNPRCVFDGNNFDYATAPYAGSFTGASVRGIGDTIPQITVTGSPTSIDLSSLGRTPRVLVNVNATGSSTIGDITGTHIGQIIYLYFPGLFTTTFDRSHAVLDAGANFVSTQYDTLTLLCVNSSGIKFVEIARCANS